MIENTPTAAAVATVTTAFGVGSILDLIPDNIGKLAALIGIILSLVLIYAHIKKGRLERRLLQLKIAEAEAKRHRRGTS